MIHYENLTVTTFNLFICLKTNYTIFTAVLSVRNERLPMSDFCIDCDRELTIFNRSGSRCYRCHHEIVTRKNIAIDPNAEAKILERNAEIEAVILTTETVSDLIIVERVEVITAEVAYGMNIFKDLFASVRDIVGGRSEAVQKTMRDARRTALFELKKEAHRVGANAVVAIDLDYVELSGGAGANMLMLVASGTAVIVKAK